MSVQNLATVFGPNILRPQMEDPVTQMEGGYPVSRGQQSSPRGCTFSYPYLRRAELGIPEVYKGIDSKTPQNVCSADKWMI